MQPVRSARAGAVIVLVALVALGFGTATTCRLWPHLSGWLLTGNPNDAILHTWWLSHTPYAIGHGRNPFVTNAMNWPEGVSAMTNTSVLLPAAVFAPITWLAGPLATLNLLNVLAVPACAAAGYWALRQIPWPTSAEPRSGAGSDQGRLTRPAALVGAVAFAISPAVVNSLNGHISMAFAAGMPILIALGVRAWFSDRGVGERWVRNGLWLGLVTAAQLFTGEEVLFQTLLASAAILLVCAVSRPEAVQAGARRLIRTLAVAVAVFLPIAGYPLYLQFFGPLKVRGSPFLPGYFGADVTAFTTPTSQLLLHTATQAQAAKHFAGGGVEEHLAYLGWPLLITCSVIAVLGWRRLPVRCAAVLLLIAMVLSLGGRLWVRGVWTEHRGPYHWLENLPVFEASLATRFGLLAAVCAGALLAFAVQLIGQWSPQPGPESIGAIGAIGAAAISLCCLGPLVPVPLAAGPAAEIPAYFRTTARNLPADQVDLVLPFPNGLKPVAMRWQAAAGFRFSMPGGYFIGPASNGRAFMGGSLDPPTARLLEEVAGTGARSPVTPKRRADAARDLAAWGVTRVVLGPDPADPQLQSTVSDLLGRKPQLVGGVAVWTMTASSG